MEICGSRVGGGPGVSVWNAAINLGIAGTQAAVNLTNNNELEFVTTSVAKGMMALSRDESLDWRPEPVNLVNESILEMLKTFRVGICVINEYNASVPKLPVSVKASDDAAVVINGSSYWIGPDRPAKLVTGATGCVTITMEITNSLYAPALIIEGDFLAGGRLEIRADSETQTYLKSVTPKQLLDGRDPFTGKEILPGAHHTDKDAEALSKTLAKICEMLEPHYAESAPTPPDCPIKLQPQRGGDLSRAGCGSFDSGIHFRCAGRSRGGRPSAPSHSSFSVTHCSMAQSAAASQGCTGDTEGMFRNSREKAESKDNLAATRAFVRAGCPRKDAGIMARSRGNEPNGQVVKRFDAEDETAFVAVHGDRRVRRARSGSGRTRLRLRQYFENFFTNRISNKGENMKKKIQKGKDWNEALSAFPESVRADIANVRKTGGKLEAAVVRRIQDMVGAEIGTLMIQLLPVAAQYAIVPISDYTVGAVSQGMPVGVGWSSLYLGANVEFSNEALSFGVHAEQSATMNAWVSGEVGLQSIAISAAPCGYCRQFLYELVTENQFNVLLPTGVGYGYTLQSLDYYLPDAFGPHDLGIQGGLMDPKYCTHNLTLQGGPGDFLVQLALQAASGSYAPYTFNYSGCAVLMSDGNSYTGKYAENAAYNPSMSPLEAAITYMNMYEALGTQRTIQRAVLVEVPTKASQKDATTDVLASFAPGVTLEYYTATSQ